MSFMSGCMLRHAAPLWMRTSQADCAGASAASSFAALPPFLGAIVSRSPLHVLIVSSTSSSELENLLRSHTSIPIVQACRCTYQACQNLWSCNYNDAVARRMKKLVGIQKEGVGQVLNLQTCTAAGGSTTSGSGHTSCCSCVLRAPPPLPPLPSDDLCWSSEGPTSSSKRSTQRKDTIGERNEGVAAAGIVNRKCDAAQSVVTSCDIVAKE